MRTKTNIFYGEGIRGFITFLTNAYPAGNLAIIYDDKELAIEIFSKMDAAMYKVKLISIAESVLPLNECVRFVIAAGGEKAVEAVKKASRKRPFCYYANEFCYQYFTSSIPSTGEDFSFGEFVYFDSTKLNLRDTKLIANAYINVFSVLTECILTAYYESNLPYVDRGLTGIICGAKKLLTDGCDIDKFFNECLRLMKEGAEYLKTKKVDMFFCAKVLREEKTDNEYQFIIDYFVNLIVINFTKWNFFDMLIPAEKLIMNVSAAKPNYRGMAQDILLTKEELSNITKKVKNLIILPQFESKKIIKTIINSINESTPLLAEINNRGILEGLVNDG